MKKTIMAACLMAASAFGAFPDFKVENISGVYEDRHGTAFAEYANYDLEFVNIAHKNIHVKFNNVNKNLVLSDDNTTVRLKMDFSFLNVFNTLKFEEVNAKSHKLGFNSSLKDLHIFIEPSEYVLENIEIASDLSSAPGANGGDVDILEGFILNGDIAIQKISLATPENKAFAKELKKEYPELFKFAQKALNIPLVGRNLRLVIKEKTFSGSVLLDSWINAWLYLGGTLDYAKDQEKLRIGLKKAKLGIFNIRNFVLNKIRNLGLDTVTVEGDQIIVDLGQVPSSRGTASR